MQAIPRAIWLHESGKQLIQWPVLEIEQLRTNPVNWPAKVLKGGELLQVNGVTAAQVRTARVIGCVCLEFFLVKNYFLLKKN